MRAYRGVNLKTIDDPATRTAFQALDHYTRQTGRALSSSIGGGQNPTAITIVVPPGPGQSSIFKDSTWTMTNALTPSKQMKFDLLNVSPSTLITLSVPNLSGTIALTSQIPSLPVPIAQGGTGQVTAQTARLALLPTYVSPADDGKVLRIQVGGSDVEWAAGGAGAPTNATYITQTANGTLTNEQNLDVLATGLLKNTFGTGILSIASATDLPIHAPRHKAGGADPISIDELDLPISAAGYPAALDFSSFAHGLCPKSTGSSTEVLHGDGVWQVPDVTPHRLLTSPGLEHLDTASNTGPSPGDLIYGDANTPSLWDRLNIGTEFHTLQSDGSAPLWQMIGPDNIENRIRMFNLPVAVWETNTKVALGGSEPNVTTVIEMLSGTFTRTHTVLRVPMDYLSSPFLNIYGAMNGTDITADVAITVYTLKLVAGTVVTAAYSNSDDGTFGPPGAANNKFLIQNVSLSISLAAGDYVRVTIERDGATDTNTDKFQFMGADFGYEADM